MEFRNVVDHLNYLQSVYLELIKDKNLKHLVEGYYHKTKYETVIECINSFDFEKIYMYANDGALLEFPGQNFIRIAEHSNSRFWLNVIGSTEFLKSMTVNKEETKQNTYIDWTYMTDSGMKTVEIQLTDVNKIYPEYYPFIKDGPDKFFTKYLDHSAPILVLIGDPGTGKTSFIRAMIDKHKLRTNVTFDEQVMHRDSYFIDYLTSDEQSLMVIEDADLLLTSRESDQNKMMAKLLNISDGIIKLVRKKIIFSTNLSNIHKIDPALVRPGRCFDVIHFRHLNYDEAVKACKRAKLPEVETGNREYVLSEIFNGRISEPLTKRIGFA